MFKYCSVKFVLPLVPLRVYLKNKRIYNYLDENCRILIFKSFFTFDFSYCPVSWMFRGETNLNKLEKLQERALRFVFRDTISPYDSLLKLGNVLPLSVYRIRCLGIEVYKFFHDLNLDYLKQSLQAVIHKIRHQRFVLSWAARI